MNTSSGMGFQIPRLDPFPYFHFKCIIHDFGHRMEIHFRPKKCQFGLKGNLMGQNIINSRLNETTEKTWKCNSIALHLESIWKVSCVYNMRRRYCSRRKLKVHKKLHIAIFRLLRYLDT